jgi:hypothetical protein
MTKRAKIKTASDLPAATLRRILADTERLAGPECDSAKALRRALTEAERRESGANPTPAFQGAAHA